MSDPQSLGRYQIKGVLGKGAMGLVYDGLDPTLNRRVAIKTILTRGLDESTAKHYNMRFQREVRAVARLNHGNIVQVYDFGHEGDLAYIVMEYIQGKELKDSFDAKQAFDFQTIFRMMGQLLDALEFAHEAGVIHRDIKPANVMIDAGGNVKLADFGVARVTEGDGDSTEKTRAGAQIGTPSYMSPEQIQGQTIDRRTDVFSAGIVFYQFLTGQKPFEGNGWALQKKIVTDDPVWPSQLVQVPDTIDRVMAKALAKETGDRYASARQFAEDLRSIAAGKEPQHAATAKVAKKAPAPDPAAAAAAAAKAAAVTSEAEKEFWEGVKDSDDPDDLGLYVEQYPAGAFLAEANKKIAALRAKKG